MTDGEWVWPEGLPHYVERHAVTLPDAFVASAAARGWKVPPRDQVPQRGEAGYEYSFWLAWARDLPPVPEAQTLPDPEVFERFCLTLQHPEADAPDDQMEAFEEGVWDKVQEEYGRPVPGIIRGSVEEQYAEWISVEHRDAVVALVLDGLRRHGLTDRVKVICSEPDPGDWQRDRDVTIWPREATAPEPLPSNDGG